MGNQTSTQTNTRLTAEDFDVLSLIGKGAFGKVWQVRKKDTGQIYAMKVLNKKNVVAENLIEHTKTEREVMLNLGRHPFIVNLNYAFQTDQQLFFILDYVGGGSLFQALSDSEMGCFSPSAVEFYAAEILLGLQALHSANIVYRDLKLENILLSSDGHVVLTDFGLSAKLKREQDKVHSFSGTAIYLAPEILADEKGEGHDMSVDWWGLGVMIFILLTGMPPFWSENHQELFDMIRTADLVIDDPNITPVAADLIHGLLKRNVSERLGCGPEGALEVKNHPFFASINWDNVLQKKLSPPFIPSKDAAEEALKNLPQHEKLKIGKKKKEDDRFRGFSYVGQQGISPLRQVDERTKKQWAVAAGLSPEELEELEANAPEVETKVQFSRSKSKPKSKLSSSSASSSSSSSSPSKDPQAAPVSVAQMAMNKKSGPKGPSSFKDKRKSSPLAKSARPMLMAQGDDDDDDDEDDDEENGSGVQIADPRSPPKASFAAPAPSPSTPKASFAAPAPSPSTPKASFAVPSPSAPKSSTSPARSSGLKTSTTASKGSGLKSSTTASSLSASETKAEPVTIAAPASPPAKESDETPKKEKTPSSPESRKKAKKVPSEDQIAVSATPEKKARRTPSDDQAPSPAEDKKKTKKSKKSSSSSDLLPPSSPSSEKKAKRTPSDDQVGSPAPEKRTKKSSSSSSSSEEKTIKKSASEEKIATPGEEKKSKKSKKTVEDRSSASSSSSDERNKMKKASSSAELSSPRSSPLSPRSEDHKKKRSKEKADPEETKEGKSHKKSSSSKDPEALLSPRSRKTKKSSDKAPA